LVLCYIEGDTFQTIIPLAPQATAHATAQATAQAAAQADKEIERLLEFCTTPRSRGEMQEFLKINHREYFRNKILNPLIKGGLLKRTIPDKPTSPNQKYYTEKTNCN